MDSRLIALSLQACSNLLQQVQKLLRFISACVSCPAVVLCSVPSPCSTLWDISIMFQRSSGYADWPFTLLCMTLMTYFYKIGCESNFNDLLIHFFKDLFLLYINGCFACMNICAHMHTWCLWRPKEVIRFPRIRVVGCYEQPCRF